MLRVKPKSLKPASSARNITMFGLTAVEASRSKEDLMSSNDADETAVIMI
jgi:hypothetical protein